LQYPKHVFDVANNTCLTMRDAARTLPS
jgi:hypothetical protein